MSNHVIETVIFRLVEGMHQERFLEAAQQATAFITRRPGFLSRRLSCEENGTWIEHVEWASMADAKAAAAEIEGAEDTRAFMSAIDGPTVKITHSELRVSVG